VFSILFLGVWGILFPLISIFFYMPTILSELYHHRRQTNAVLRSMPTMDSARYLRIAVIASIDLLLMFPIGVSALYINLRQIPHPRFWPVWASIDAAGPPALLAEDAWRANVWIATGIRLAQVRNVVVGLTIAVLFGITADVGSARWVWESIAQLAGRRAPSASPAQSVDGSMKAPNGLLAALPDHPLLLDICAGMCPKRVLETARGHRRHLSDSIVSYAPHRTIVFNTRDKPRRSIGACHTINLFSEDHC